MTDAQFNAWLKDQSAIRCILVEASVKTSGGSVVTRYLSNKGYTSGKTDTPANTHYAARIIGGLKFTQSLSIDGEVSISFGDIELDNADGALDSWLDDFWTNRSVKVFIGDMMWSRNDFRQVLEGVAIGIDTRSRNSVNIKLSDKLQRLNAPITEVKLGGTGTDADKLLPLCFGECHNITPLLVDEALHEYMVHNGPIEDIIEVRDNGVPVSITKFLNVGKFRLNQSAVGTITASVQGYKNDGSRNLLTATSTLNVVPWTRTRLADVVSAQAPDGSNTAFSLVEDTTTGNRALNYSISASVVPNEIYTFSVFAKAGAVSRGLRLRTANPGNTAILDGAINLSMGQRIGGGAGSFRQVKDVGNGWYYIAMEITVPASVSSLSISMWLVDANGSTTVIGSGLTGATVWNPRFERGTGHSPLLAFGGYTNNIATLIGEIATVYGNQLSRFSGSDLDVQSLMSFSAANTQPVGVFVSDRDNVLDVCNKLATSIGARMVISADGLLSLKRLELPQAAPGTTVTASDMVDRTLHVAEMPDVKAGVKIGYCKNWTVQTGLQTGIPEAHIKLYADEWLTQTQTDTAAAANYNIHTDPTMEETYLLTSLDAINEAMRRLNLFNVQRKRFKYTGFYHLIQEQLGNPQTIQHSRFGLSNGKTGQIVSVSMDWVSPHVEIEVLI